MSGFRSLPRRLDRGRGESDRAAPRLAPFCVAPARSRLRDALGADGFRERVGTARAASRSGAPAHTASRAAHAARTPRLDAGSSVPRARPRLGRSRSVVAARAGPPEVFPTRRASFIQMSARALSAPGGVAPRLAPRASLERPRAPPRPRSARAPRRAGDPTRAAAPRLRSRSPPAAPLA